MPPHARAMGISMTGPALRFLPDNIISFPYVYLFVLQDAAEEVAQATPIPQPSPSR